MNTLIVDIRESVVRAIISQEGGPRYHRVFRHSGLEEGDETASGEGMSLPEILKTIRSESGCFIESAGLILPPEQVHLSKHTTAKVSVSDAEKIIGRKIVAESKEEYPPFSILPGASDQKTQTWQSLYVPTATIKHYQKIFRANRIKLKSITTPVNAMLEAFKSVRETIFNADAVFEISAGYVEAYYISSDGILHTECLSYLGGGKLAESGVNDPEKMLKQLMFKIINTIFKINSHYQLANPQTPVQLAWVCGEISGLDEIAEALKEAMSVEVAIAPSIQSGMDDENAYVPLIAFAAALEGGTAVSYAAADFFKRFPLRKTYGIAIYSITSLMALLAMILTEREYQSLRTQVEPLTQGSAKGQAAKVVPSYLKNLETLKKLTSQQFLFYPLFRELANDLPDGIVLESLDYRFKDDKGTIVVTALAPLGVKGNGSELPGRLMALFHHSPSLQNYREPAISTVTKEKDQYLKIVFTSEVKPLDATK